VQFCKPDALFFQGLGVLVDCFYQAT